jgi:Cytochrome P460
MRRLCWALALFSCSELVINAAAAQDNIPPPTSADRAFAVQLWDAMFRARLVGDNSVRTAPFTGGPTHTEVLEYLEQNVRVGFLDGLAIIKKNYTDQNGKTVSISKAWADPKTYLMSITVMYRRRGYDTSRKNWFWAEYEPTGKATYAGKVDHCIVCHQPAPGGDFRFLPLPE